MIYVKTFRLRFETRRYHRNFKRLSPGREIESREKRKDSRYIDTALIEIEYLNE